MNPEGTGSDRPRNDLRDKEEQFLIFLAEKRVQALPTLNDIYEQIVVILNERHGNRESTTHKPAFLLFKTVRAFRRALIDVLATSDVAKYPFVDPSFIYEVYTILPDSFTPDERNLLDINYALMEHADELQTHKWPDIVVENSFTNRLNSTIFDGKTAYTLIYTTPPRYKTCGLGYAIVDTHSSDDASGNILEEISDILRDLFYFTLEEIDIRTLTIALRTAKEYSVTRGYTWWASLNTALRDMLSPSSAVSQSYWPFKWKLSSITDGY